MNIIYFSADMSKYNAALYQQDVIDEFRKQHEVFFYGPGFPLYNKNDTVSDVISKSSFNTVDLICIGHAWLSDSPDVCEIDPHPKINFSKLSILKAMILNKEYTNLEKKLSYIVRNKIDIVFTHHHNVNYFMSRTGVRFIFWPFAVNHRCFEHISQDKEYDIFFSGILRNPNFPQTQSNIRVRIQNKLFYSPGGVRLFIRPKYREYKIFWRVYTGSKLERLLRRYLFNERRLPKMKYFEILSKSKICINTLSPLDLISTRYYESMAARCLVFCQKSPIYGNLFKDGKHCVMFDDDLSDFEEKLLWCLENDEKRKIIVENAYQHVLKNHTWEIRIKQFTEEVKKYYRVH